MAGEVRPRPGPAPSHSTPSLTAPVCHRPAQRTTEVPANSRHHGPRAVPSVSSVLILPPGPIADRHRRPQERLQAARDLQPTRIQARIIAPVTPSHPSAVLTPSTCMNRWIRAYTPTSTSSPTPQHPATAIGVPVPTPSPTPTPCTGPKPNCNANAYSSPDADSHSNRPALPYSCSHSHPNTGYRRHP